MMSKFFRSSEQIGKLVDIIHRQRKHAKRYALDDDGGGQLLYFVLSLTNAGALYISNARRLLSVLCSRMASEYHVCLDKYIDSSTKGYVKDN